MSFGNALLLLAALCSPLPIYAFYQDPCFTEPLSELARPIPAQAGESASRKHTVTYHVFRERLSLVEKTYQPIFAQKGLTLVIDSRWQNTSLSACSYIAPYDTRVRHIAIYGGIARHKNITADALTLIACHEN